MKHKILIVDDTPYNVKVLFQAIKSPDYEIVVAKNGKAALDLACTQKPDLILLDIKMPEMDGYEVCKKLKEDEATKKIPIVFVTALDEEDDETLGLELGAVDYITKPFRSAIVRARVKNHLELKKQRDILEGLSCVDGLTNIMNRRRFNEHLENEWCRAVRSESHIGVIMIDIDSFKAYNDHYGHPAGDECLKKVAGELRKNMERTTDSIARYGGEEFICLLPSTDKKGSIKIAERLHKSILNLNIPHACSDTGERVTISLGVASMVPRGDDTSDTLIEEADKALYEAKKAGKNKVLIVND